MSRKERWIASIFGTLIGGAGLVALFTTGNQAGTAVALLLAGVMMLIGVQGTPLVRFGSGDHSFEMERRREEITELAAAVSSTDPGQAEALIEGFTVADPASRHDPDLVAVMRHIYHEQIRAALAHLRMRDQRWSVVQDQIDSDHAAFMARSPESKIVSVHALAVFSPDARKILGDIPVRMFSYLAVSLAQGAVIVTNSATAFQLASEMVARSNESIEVIRWTTPEHNEDLLDAIERIAAGDPPA